MFHSYNYIIVLSPITGEFVKFNKIHLNFMLSDMIFFEKIKMLYTLIVDNIGAQKIWLSLVTTLPPGGINVLTVRLINNPNMSSIVSHLYGRSCSPA